MKILIAMSGGVDSSVAAKQMVDQGCSCIGCTMKLYQNEDIGVPRGHTCCALDDVEDARSVAYRLGIPYYVFNFSEDFHAKVVEPFIQSYQCGETPNPCIDCNRFMKFEKLLRRAVELGCDAVATGHYARIAFDGTRWLLKKAVDETKDQSYVLYHLTQAQLAKIRFPLGGLRKTEVRAIAAQCGFDNAQKPDSQDICFVPDGDYAGMIERATGQKAAPGAFVDESGRILGTHRGLIHYTVGQRRGLGLALPAPLYVCRLCTADNTVRLGRGPALYRAELTVRAFHWISGEVPGAPFRCKAKIRYRQAEQAATVTPVGADAVRVVFDQPQRAVTPGQSAVLYDGDTVLGGGIIE